MDSKDNNENKTKIKATSDLAFKKVLGTTGNEDILAGLIKDFFGFSPVDVRITNPYNITTYQKILDDSYGDYSKLKQTLNDVGAEFSNGDFIAEAQVRKQDEYTARALYYSFSAFCNNHNKSLHAYKDLISVYSLNILKESYFADETPGVRIFRLYDDYAKIHIDRDYVAVGFFELMKECGLRNRNQQYWRQYFLGEKLPEDAPEYIRRAERLIEVVNLDKEERHMLSLEEKYEADQQMYLETALREGEEKGIIKGRVEGRVEGQLELARKFKAAGAEKTLIMKTADLTEQEFEDL